MNCPAPTVSVIIATYNRANFLGEAIASVLQQSYNDFELIIIDDGSTDDTQDMIAKINDSRLHFIYQQNKGRSNARNVGLSLAQGRYITFLDSDDLYLPDKLSLQVEYLNKNLHVGMVYTSALCIDQNGNYLPHIYHATVSGYIYKYIAFFVPITITLPTVMVRREIFLTIDGFDENMQRFEDTDMWRRISKNTCIGAINIYTCKLRTHFENDLVNQNPRELIEALYYYTQKILREDTKKNGFFIRNRGLGKLYFHYACALNRVSQWKEFSQELLQIACNYWPIYRFFILKNKIMPNFR